MTSSNTAFALDSGAINSCTLPPIGTEIAGGYFAGIIWLPTSATKYALIVAGKDGEFVGEWGNYRKKIDGAGSLWDGAANTDAMIAAGSELAHQIRALRIGGFNDWSIPARDQLEVLYRNLKPTETENYCWFMDGYNAHGTVLGTPYTPADPARTPIESFQQGGDAAFEPNWYWSSTQYSAYYAYSQDFSDGNQSHDAKTTELRARAVRMIQLSD